MDKLVEMRIDEYARIVRTASQISEKAMERYNEYKIMGLYAHATAYLESAKDAQFTAKRYSDRIMDERYWNQF